MARSERSTADAAGARAEIPATLAELRVPTDTLREYAHNPRRGDEQAIARSLETNGQYRPIVVRAHTNEVLAGNHTLRAARTLGWTEIAATYVDVDDETAARIVIVDNRANDLAAYDSIELAELLSTLGTLDGTLYTQADLDELIATFAPAGEDEQGLLDQLQPKLVTCPECGHEFAP